jgi:hypothetical protein
MIVLDMALADKEAGIRIISDHVVWFRRTCLANRVMLYDSRGHQPRVLNLKG